MAWGLGEKAPPNREVLFSVNAGVWVTNHTTEDLHYDTVKNHFVYNGGHYRAYAHYHYITMKDDGFTEFMNSLLAARGAEQSNRNGHKMILDESQYAVMCTLRNRPDLVEDYVAKSLSLSSDNTNSSADKNRHRKEKRPPGPSLYNPDTSRDRQRKKSSHRSGSQYSGNQPKEYDEKSHGRRRHHCQMPGEKEKKSKTKNFSWSRIFGRK